MNRKIWKALGIAVCMLALAAPRAMAVSHRVGSDAEFKDAVEAINQSGDAKNEIILTQNFTLEGNTTDYTLTNGKETTIKGADHTITISMAGITVTGEKTVLNLGAEGYDGTLTIDGDTTAAFVTVSDRATANMYKNVTLKDEMELNKACVVITGSKSVFNMRGGEIEKCNRAVWADLGATFHMLSGKILNCVNKSDGGGVLLYGATFIMDGGTISGCTALDSGGGLYATNQSTITINNGTISGCEASAGAGGGLYVDGSTLTIKDGEKGGEKGGEISGCKANTGGGLYATNQSTINISGGTIKGNEAAYGGGVALIGSTINPITHWTVSGNKADNIGGGIYLENGLMDVSAGSNRIYNNTINGHGADIFLYNGSSAIRLPNAANMDVNYLDSGMKIDGWYKNKPRYTPSKDGEAVKVDGEEPLKGELSLVASYKTTCTVTIDTNGGKGGSSSQTVQKGTTVTLEAPAKEGHLFKGWKDEEKGNSYPAGEDGKVNITVNENMKLTAVWKARTFTVTYVLLNGETRTETVDYGKTVTLGEEPRTGYTFVGWKDGENVYRAGETITVTEDKTLTAVWEARTFTVTYVLLNGETRTKTVNYGQTVTLVEEPRTGYTFVGWKDGEKMYRAGETITVTGDMTLTAVWEARSFTVTYVLLNGKTRAETVDYGKTVTLGEEPRTGYTFVGWKDGEEMYHAGETITVTEDKTLTAVWEARTFTVTYVLLNGETRAETVDYGQTVTLGEEPRTGYTFVGWKDGEKMYHAGETITVTGDMTLTAEWKKLPSAENLPKTGDESPVLLWGAALAVSAAACFVLRRKK